jgi:hypothetical protein
MTTRENSRSRPGGAESLLNGQSLVKKMSCSESKNDFCKNQELVLLPVKCKPTSVPPKSAGACAKFKIYLQRFPQQKESWYAYPRWYIIYVGCCTQLSILRFGSCFIKKTGFGTPKIEKTLFVGWNKKQPPWHSSSCQGTRACPICPRSDKLCHDQDGT